MKEKKLIDLCLNITDGVHSTVIDDLKGDCYLLSCKNVKDGKIKFNNNDRFINFATLNHLRKRTKMEKGDVILTTVGTIGESSVIKDLYPKYEFQRSVAIIKPNKDLILPKYLHYFLISKKGQNQIAARIKGAAQPCLFLSDLKQIEIELSDIQTQQHIVNTIGSIDDLIEKQNLKFDKIMNTSMIIFSSFESKHKCNFKEAFRSFNGGTFKSKFYVEESDYKLITIKNINDLGFDATKTAFLNKENANLKYKLSIGDILLTMTGNIGRSGIVDEENCYQNQRILKISCISQLYLLCYLNKYKNNIIQLGKGTAQLNLSLEDINNLTVFNSPKEISKFSKYDAIFDELLNIKLQIKKLKSIKKSLLNKYFTNQQ